MYEFNLLYTILLIDLYGKALGDSFKLNPQISLPILIVCGYYTK